MDTAFSIPVAGVNGRFSALPEPIAILIARQPAAGVIRAFPQQKPARVVQMADDEIQTIDGLSNDEIAELIEAGRVNDEGDILPAEDDGNGSEDDQNIEGSDEGEQGEDNAKTDDKPGDDNDAVKTKSEPDPEKSDVKAEDGDSDADDTDKDGDPEKVMIPKQRFDQVSGRMRQLEEALDQTTRELAWHEGRESVRSETAKTQSDAEPAKDQKTVDQLQAEIDDLWEKADEGDLTLSQARKLEREKQAEIDQLKQSESNANRKEPEQQPDLAKSIADREINRAAQKVVEAHPYLDELSENDVAYLGSKLDEQIKSQGLREPRDPIDRHIWRMEQIGMLSDKYGPGLTGKTLTKKTEADPEPTPEQKREAAKAKADDRLKKQRVAQQQPPNSTATGAAEGGVGEYTDEQIANMSETELETLPDTVIDRMAKGAS